MASQGQLTNHWYCMRHGRSRANEAGIIISSPDTGRLPEWGLAPGAEVAIRESVRTSGLGRDTVILSSPFSRTMETAALAAELLNAPVPQPAAELRERWFGEFEGSTHENYGLVWEVDRENTDHGWNGVESPLSVQARVLSLVNKTEEKQSGRTILLVSHGDPTDILLCWGRNIELESHMDMGMATAEIRSLLPDGLPETTC